MRTPTQRLNAFVIESIRTAWIERYGVRPSYKWCQSLYSLCIAKDVAPRVLVSRFPKQNRLFSNNPYPYLGWLRSGKPEAREALTLKDDEESYYGWLAKQSMPYIDKGQQSQTAGPMSVGTLLSQVTRDVSDH